MAFIPTLPTFNLMGDYLGPPSVSDVPFQLYWPSRSLLDIQANARTLWVPPIYVRLGKDFLDYAPTPWVGKLFRYEATDEETYYFKIRWWEYLHVGFPNEYLVWLVEQCNSSGVCPDPDR